MFKNTLKIINPNKYRLKITQYLNKYPKKRKQILKTRNMSIDMKQNQDVLNQMFTKCVRKTKHTKKKCHLTPYLVACILKVIHYFNLFFFV